MARVDFYILSQSGEQARQLFACRLAEKAWRLDNTVHIRAPDRETAARIDDLLWTFRDGSFVPHHIAGNEQDGDSPVVVGFDDRLAASRDLLINLCDDVPACAEAFPRIAELVTSDDDSRQKSRRRFSAYRDLGHELETHEI